MSAQGLSRVFVAGLILAWMSGSAAAEFPCLLPRPWWCRPEPPSLAPETPAPMPEPAPAIEPPAPAPAALTTAALTPNNFGDTFGTFCLPVVVRRPVLDPDLCGCQSFQIFEVCLPNPSSGGTVGRSKISEDNNPLPRDRFIFNYDYFNNAPLTPTGWDVNRYIVGFEKTFFNQMASVEVRLPFASTLDSNIYVDKQRNNDELGNLRIVLRGLLYNSDNFVLGGGLAIDLPTADDVRLFLDNRELMRVENEAVVLAPFLGALFAPTDRLFVQTWGAVNFDTNGNEVLGTFNGSLQPIGRFSSQTTMDLDLQVGYWVVQNPQARFLRALAPILELHYGANLEDSDVINTGSFTIADPVNRRDELNVTAGLIAQLGNNVALSIGSVMPLRQPDDRSFDFQFGVRLNWFFGPTAADQNNYFRLIGN